MNRANRFRLMPWRETGSDAPPARPTPPEDVFVYGDVSGDTGTSVIVAAGYLSVASKWAAVTSVWTKILEDAGVPYFRATDFFAARGPFQGWVLNDERHREFSMRFTAAADEAGLIGFAYAMDRASFQEILAPVLRLEQRQYLSDNPRTYAAGCMLACIDEFLKKTDYRRPQQIQVVFEEEPGGGRYSNFLGEARKRHERWSWWFKDLTIATKATIQLQIADLLAHEAWREATRVFTNSTRPPRKSFERMLRHENLEFKWLRREDCERNARVIRDLLTRYPNGLVPPEDTLPGM